MVFVSIKVRLRTGICRLVLKGSICIYQGKLNIETTRSAKWDRYTQLLSTP
jgi:hypothetical protein